MQPAALLQPLGQSTNAGAPGQLAEGSHVTSQAHASAQRTPPLQLPLPLHATEQAAVPQRTPKPQLFGPSQLMAQLDDVPQSSEPHESRPMQWIAQGASPHVAPKKQLRSPVQSTSQLDASPQSTSVMQPCVRVQRTRHGMSGGHTIDERSSPRI